MTRYLELVFRSKLRLVVLLLLLPVALSALDLYLWRSYDVAEVVWVPDPAGQGVAAFLGYSPYQTASQNAARLFSNLVGTESFNSAVADRLAAQGVVKSDRDRATVIASMALLTVTPGAAVPSGSSSSSSGASGGSPADHSMTIRNICTKEAVCLAILPAVLDVLKSQYQDLKTQAAASLRAIYVANQKAAQASYDAAVAANTAYVNAHPPVRGATPTSDPVLTSLQHDVDQAQKTVDDATVQVQGLDTLVELSNAVIGGIVVVDGPRTAKGLYGIKGMRSDNLKTDSIVLAACLAAAAIYLILVAFLDRSVRDPGHIKSKLGKPVVIIPAFQSGTHRGKLKKSA